MKRQIASLMLGAAACLAAALPASADLSAQAVPMKYNLTVRAGERVMRDVLISNSGTNPVVVHVRLSDWDLDAGGDMNLLPAGSGATSLQGLVTVEPQEFSLPPGESRAVHVTLAMPADGAATRWGVLLSEIRPADLATRAGPRAIAQLGTTIYLSRIAEHDLHPDVVGMEVQPVGEDSLRVRVRVRNAGERHFYVSTGFTVAHSAGARVGGGTAGTGVVLPGEERWFTWMTPAPAAAGTYTATASLDTGEPELLVADATFVWPPHRLPIAAR